MSSPTLPLEFDAKLLQRIRSLMQRMGIPPHFRADVAQGAYAEAIAGGYDGTASDFWLKRRVIDARRLTDGRRGSGKDLLLTSRTPLFDHHGAVAASPPFLPETFREVGTLLHELRTVYDECGGWTPGFEAAAKILYSECLRDILAATNGSCRKRLREWAEHQPKAENGWPRGATHQQIARYTGTTRESVTRNLNDLIAEGVIEKLGTQDGRTHAYRLRGS